MLFMVVLDRVSYSLSGINTKVVALLMHAVRVMCYASVVVLLV
jgi:hypothetical protein